MKATVMSVPESIENSKPERVQMTQPENFTSEIVDQSQEVLMEIDSIMVPVPDTPCDTEPYMTAIQSELDLSHILVARKLDQEPKIFPTEGDNQNFSINACGHPCVLCYQCHLQTAPNKEDHNYAIPLKYVSVGTQTDPLLTEMTAKQEETPSKIASVTKTTSTPTRKVLDFALPTINVESIRDISKDSSFRDDTCDRTFSSEMLDSDSEPELDVCEELGSDVVEDRKFIIFESAIDKIMKFVSCPVCRSPVCPDDIVKDTSEGTLLKCDLFCIQGHHIVKWISQPMLGKMPAGNLLLSASILFSGLSFSRIQQMASFLGLKMFSQSTFTSIQRNLLMPVVLHSWQLMQDEILDQVKASGRALRLAGDGRCDSPGFSAKYCTYSLMELSTNNIVAFVVVGVTETGSSSKMEVEGFRRCVEMLLDKGFRIEVLATDRHVQIRSILKKDEKFMGIDHQFDVWHLAKSVKKKLTAKAKVKGAEELHEWIKAITNHLWWCASNCNSDADWLEECWVSVVNHAANIHLFSGECITACPHEPLDPEVARKKKWLKLGSKAHNGLKEVVLDKRLRKDIRQLSAFCHTGNLEVYHSLMTKYIPKRQEFDFDQMVTRTALVAMDHNMSQNREQKINKSGEKMYRALCPKATGQWIVRKVYEDKNYKWVDMLLKMVVDQKDRNFLPPTTVKKRKNIAPRPAPKKSDLVTNLKSRFLNC